MIELQDKIEAECVNNTELWVQSNRRTPPNQTRTTLPPTPIPTPTSTPNPYRFCQEPTDEVLREKGERKKKKNRGIRRALEHSGVWRNGREKKRTKEG